MNRVQWIGNWENMNRLQRSGRKAELGTIVIREATVVLERLPVSDRNEFAVMFALDHAAGIVMHREGIK